MNIVIIILSVIVVFNIFEISSLNRDVRRLKETSRVNWKINWEKRKVGRENKIKKIHEAKE